MSQERNVPPFLRLKEIRLPEPEKFLYEVDFEMLALEGGVIPGKFIAKVRFDHGGRFRHPRIEEIEKTAKKQIRELLLPALQAEKL